MPIDPKKALGAQLGEGKYTWTKDQVILYHLGLGAGVPPTDPGELEYTYEKNLKVLPSYGVIPVFGALGGLGGEPGPKVGNQAPDRKPDGVIEVATLPQQALIYRLSGDKNPLHADPDFARMGGFDRPIIHR